MHYVEELGNGASAPCLHQRYQESATIRGNQSAMSTGLCNGGVAFHAGGKRVNFNTGIHAMCLLGPFCHKKKPVRFLGIDPKTFRKWVWMFIENIQELVDVVVSISLNLLVLF
jgi:hypothetical protein